MSEKQTMAVTSLDIEGFNKVASGKVREIFDLGEHYLFVATDRISAFDCVMPNGIPGKGAVLTALSNFWFDHLEGVRNHLISTSFPAELQAYANVLQDRSMVVRKLEMVPVECVVRGFLVGSGFKEYRGSGKVCGIDLPSGLQLADRLEQPIFTPAAKATSGHDENISFDQMVNRVGADLAERLRDLSLQIYQRAFEYAWQRGVIIADTKFEFGLVDDRIYLADEVLTPDSSRYWPRESYRVGQNPPSFDKQYVRDYLETLDWNKQPPAPALPDSIVAGTAKKYAECLRLLTT